MLKTILCFLIFFGSIFQGSVFAVDNKKDDHGERAYHLSNVKNELQKLIGEDKKYSNNDEAICHYEKRVHGLTDYVMGQKILLFALESNDIEQIKKANLYESEWNNDLENMIKNGNKEAIDLLLKYKIQEVKGAINRNTSKLQKNKDRLEIVAPTNEWLKK